ncbi:hypothetical protein L6164_037107 [Bauhinia variegata]|uniref:Uncharacterized protein n=1 Tax=Bauhinia variegata TaxID=167791 RepID=A0ACB9KJ95_BAUVA|nr:hypothetical protein L6164_037107 [Bauhinia variegata]
MRTALFGLCLFLFACSATSVIIDTDGEAVRNSGGAYYLVPVKEPTGGLGLATVGNDNFPRTLVFDTNLTNVLPVRFAARESMTIIKSSFFVDINFVVPSAEPAGWIVQPEFPIGWTVKIEQNEIWGYQFRVLPAKTGYKIVYYPERGVIGAALRIVYSGGYHLLVVKDEDPFIFRVKKATESSARIVSIV